MFLNPSKHSQFSDFKSLEKTLSDGLVIFSNYEWNLNAFHIESNIHQISNELVTECYYNLNDSIDIQLHTKNRDIQLPW